MQENSSEPLSDHQVDPATSMLPAEIVAPARPRLGQRLQVRSRWRLVYAEFSLSVLDLE